MTKLHGFVLFFALAVFTACGGAVVLDGNESMETSVDDDGGGGAISVTTTTTVGGSGGDTGVGGFGIGGSSPVKLVVEDQGLPTSNTCSRAKLLHYSLRALDVPLEVVNQSFRIAAADAGAMVVGSTGTYYFGSFSLRDSTDGELLMESVKMPISVPGTTDVLIDFTGSITLAPWEKRGLVLQAHEISCTEDAPGEFLAKQYYVLFLPMEVGDVLDTSTSPGVNLEPYEVVQPDPLGSSFTVLP